MYILYIFFVEKKKLKTLFVFPGKDKQRYRIPAESLKIKMKLSICGLFILLIAYTIEARYYVVRTITAGNRKRKDENWEFQHTLIQEKRRKCAFATKFFANTSNTCVVTEPVSYTAIYEDHPQQVDLWNFYQENCLVTITKIDVFMVVVYFLSCIGWFYYCIYM